MKIAVVGGGISGLVAAYLLCDEHRIKLFEANDYIGGHTNTIDVRVNGHSYPIDTGFIVFNDRAYPNFIRLLDHLGVETQPTSMSFSLRCRKTGLEYNGTSINRLFAQRRNLLKPSFWKLCRDILRFYRDAPSLMDVGPDLTVGEFLDRGGYGQGFVDKHLLPLSAAIWSSNPERVREFPLRFFMGFMDNHGMLSVNDRPPWRVIRGGSRRYVEKIVQPFQRGIRLGTPVKRIERFEDRVEVTPEVGQSESFDHVILAVHSDQALAMLADASPRERSILGAIGYQANDTLLHSDPGLMPRNRRAWASWNYYLPRQTRRRVAVTYYSNSLQSLQGPEQFFVTLNQTKEIEESKQIRRLTYHHPNYSLDSYGAQKRHSEISGIHRTHYCGAYWGYGFHEDGVNSALAVCRYFGKGLS